MTLATDEPILSVDFGTSNSAACWVEGGEITVIPLEADRPTIPSAIFFSGEDLSVIYGSEAIRRYEAGMDGRLMKALKTVLSSALIDESTAIRGGYIQYRRVLELFLQHIKDKAEQKMGGTVSQALLGRPVHFIEDNPERDRKAERTLAEIAEAIGLARVEFQYEPIAAAIDYEVQLEDDRIVLVVDIGGGTSDFSLINLGPGYRNDADRVNSVIGTAGVRIAGTDFDKYVNLATTMQTMGMDAIGRSGRRLPDYLYRTLSTWHEINTAYNADDISATKQLRPEFADLQMHDRLMTTLLEKLGHRIIGSAERAKVAAAEGGSVDIDLGFVEEALVVSLGADILLESVEQSVSKILECVEDLVQRSEVAREDISALYFTGGSSGLKCLREAFREAFPASEAHVGEQFTSVSQGLSLAALRGYWVRH